jgi:hypothetical protein
MVDAAVAMGPRWVLSRYGTMLGEKGKREVVAPTSLSVVSPSPYDAYQTTYAPMLHIVAMPVQLRLFRPGP